jgi:translation initiation factor 2 beta subunit (eIF-2beta)/eIF-5
MVKKVLLVLVFCSCVLFAENSEEQSIYDKNCVSCHRSVSIGLDKIFFRYLIKYSSELSVKTAMIDFLKNPNIQTSAMTDEQIRLLGVKIKTHLSDAELKEAIDRYWDKYKVFGKLW